MSVLPLCYPRPQRSWFRPSKWGGATVDRRLSQAVVSRCQTFADPLANLSYQVAL